MKSQKEERGKDVRIRIEISDDAQNEIVIKCRDADEKVRDIEKAIQNVLKQSGEMTLYIGNTEYYVQKSEILFFESNDQKVYAHTISGMYTTPYKLFELEELMPACFVRISKSVIANIYLIASLNRELTGNGEITFKGCGKKTYFSRSYYKNLKQKIEEMRFGK